MDANETAGVSFDCLLEQYQAGGLAVCHDPADQALSGSLRRRAVQNWRPSWPRLGPWTWGLAGRAYTQNTWPRCCRWPS